MRKWITVVKPKVHQSWLKSCIDESLEEDVDCKELISIEVFKLTVRDLELNGLKRGYLSMNCTVMGYGE